MKVLLFDVENLPIIAHTWRLHYAQIGHQDIIEDASLISVAWKWRGQSKTYSSSIFDDPKRLQKDVYDDYVPAKEFHSVLNSDKDFVICGHNVKRFDIKKINTAFIKHGLCPVPDRQIIDTLQQARKHFRFDSNRLDYLARFLDVGEKIDTGGMQLWRDILQLKYPPVGKDADLDLAMSAGRQMVRYNKHDVKINEGVLDALWPKIDVPTYSLYTGQVVACTKCGGKSVVNNGWRYTAARKYRRYWCNSCEAPFDPPRSVGKWIDAELT